jgi:hypothetical protein
MYGLKPVPSKPVPFKAVVSGQVLRSFSERPLAGERLGFPHERFMGRFSENLLKKHRFVQKN